MLGRESLNMPNLITTIRLLLSFVLFSLIAAGGWWITAAALFAFAASTDALDGYLARRYQQITVLGRILDPFVDKVIVCGTFVFLLEKQGEHDSGVNAWMVITIVGREMFVSSLRGILEKQGKDFSASLAGKLKMSLQCVAVTASLLSLARRFPLRDARLGALRRFRPPACRKSSSRAVNIHSRAATSIRTPSRS